MPQSRLHKKLRLGDLLVTEGVITHEQLTCALEIQQKTGARLGRILVLQGFISEVRLLEFLAQQLDVEFIDLSQLSLDPEIVRKLPEVYARRYRALVVAKDDIGYTVGLADPLDFSGIDAIQASLDGAVQFAVVKESELLAAIENTYQRGHEIRSLAGELETSLVEFDSGRTEISLDSASDTPVARLIKTLFEQAVSQGASDIHIEPDISGVRIRQRVDGFLHEHVLEERRIAQALVLRLKLMAGLDIAEKRMPQDGRFHVVVKGHQIDIRIATMPIQHGESVVMRILDSATGVIPLDRLGMSDENHKQLSRYLHAPNGLVLVTGPTGSGKTTTLYAALNEINSADQKIITIEDPVEYQLPRINQVQVNARIGLTFASVLRSALRQDPDIIMVGEMRDTETAEMAIRGALTGHLVLSTLHTNDAISTAIRLIDMGVAPYLASGALRLVISQRLVRKLCSACKQTETVPEETLAMFRRLGIALLTAHDYYSPVGCSLCNQTGYKGRIGVYEFLPFDEQIANALRGGDTELFTNTAKQSPNYQPIHVSAMHFANEGITSLKEVLSITQEV